MIVKLVFGALALLVSFAAINQSEASDPELCSTEVIAIVDNQEEETIEVINSLENALPPEVLPINLTTNGTENILPELYNSVAEELDERTSESGYSQFVEALTEIVVAYTEACSGENIPGLEDVSELVSRYIQLTSSNETNAEKRREVFGKMLCIQNQESTGARRRRDVCHCTCPCPSVEVCESIQCSCQFFRCLDPEDDYKPLFGFERKLKQSLGMVVDTTGSMVDEIEAAKEVMTNLIAREEDVDIYYYVLTPFNDYGEDHPSNFGPSVIALATQLEEVQTLVRDITSLFADGGGDCPEYALNAVLHTLNTTDPRSTSRKGDKYIMVPGSQIVVLTDAGSKNPELVDKVIEEAESRGVCIHFLYPPDCCCENGSVLYTEIASRTGGIVIDSLSDIDAIATLDQFVQYYELNPCKSPMTPTRSRRQAASEDGYSNEQVCHRFNVSSLTALLKLVVNTIQPEVTVTKPSGSTTSITTANQYGSLFLSTPESGEWLACVANGTFRYTVNAEVDIDIIVSYVVEGQEGKDEVKITTTTPAACYTSKVTVTSTRAADISSAVLLLVDDDENTATTVELSKCGSSLLIGSFTAPPGFATYHLQGEDRNGIPFTYKTRRTATFSEANYLFTVAVESDAEITESGSVSLVYRFENTDLHGYASLDFTATSEPKGQFILTVDPESLVLEAGQAIDVTVSAVIANSSLAEIGTGATIGVTATDGCTFITSDFYNVTITESSNGARVTHSLVLVTVLFVFVSGVIAFLT